jgi:AcrR family transcriptional regulator
VTTVDGLGRRERRKQETRRALIRAALALAIEHGPDGVTVEMITDAADVSPRTFFNYFSSKDEALVCLDESDGLIRALEEHDTGDPLVALRAALRDHAGEIMDDVALWRMRVRLLESHPELKARMVASLEPLERRLSETIAHRCGLDADRDVYPALVCATALAAGRISLRLWMESGCEQPITAIVDDAFDLIESGLRPPRSNPTPTGDPSPAAS